MPLNFDRLKKLFWISIGGQFVLLAGVLFFMAEPFMRIGSQSFLFANIVLLAAFLVNVYSYRKNIAQGLMMSEPKERLDLYIQTVMLQLSFLEIANLLIVLLIFWKHDMALAIPGLLCISLFWYFRPTVQRFKEDMQIDESVVDALVSPGEGTETENISG